MINLRFVGMDGSMRLVHGRVYRVRVMARKGYIWVVIPNFEFRPMSFWNWRCPYYSPQSFAANWERA